MVNHIIQAVSKMKNAASLLSWDTRQLGAIARASIMSDQSIQFILFRISPSFAVFYCILANRSDCSCINLNLTVNLTSMLVMSSSK